MNLMDAKTNTKCEVKSISIDDTNTKIRLMELGLIVGSEVMVKSKSSLKKTLLIVFNSSCFTLKDNLAKSIEVIYV